MKTVFATVIYKQARPFLTDFLKSVDNQTDKNFDLLIINDNYTQAELKEVQDVISENIHELDVHLVDLSEKHLSIAGTRIEMLRNAKHLGYDLVVMGDADDTFSKDRVKGLKEACQLDKDALFFYNRLVTDNGKDVFKVIPKELLSIKQISQSNFVGMSTSAIRLEPLSDEFFDSLYEGESPVFDWYLFSRLLMDFGKGCFSSKGATNYRIYDNNEVGTSRDINKEYEVKKIHYTNLAKRYDYFKYLLANLNDLDQASLKPAKNHLGYWWSDIKMEDNYEI